jgi:hypothetical protein
MSFANLSSSVSDMTCSERFKGITLFMVSSGVHLFPGSGIDRQAMLHSECTTCATKAGLRGIFQVAFSCRSGRIGNTVHYS